MGPVKNNDYLQLTDAGWNEKTAAVLLLAGILVMGLVPFWITDLINPGTEVIIQKIGMIK
jgi:NADH-quinone oxidoreductase subunit M